MTTRIAPDLNCAASPEDKSDIKMAYVRYLATCNLTAEQGLTWRVEMKKLLPFLSMQNRKWNNIPYDKMTATFKRVHHLYNHVKTWRNNVTQVKTELDNWNRI